jgi:hypothetical protein
VIRTDRCRHESDLGISRVVFFVKFLFVPDKCIVAVAIDERVRVRSSKSAFLYS